MATVFLCKKRMKKYIERRARRTIKLYIRASCEY